jgi:hypothetical protein
LLPPFVVPRPLKAADLNIYVLMVLFILFAASINMLMGSAFGQVGHYGTCIHTYIYAHGLFTRIIAGGFPHWR